MSTRSHIGYVNEDGTINAVYCHYDGYPSHMIPILAEYVELHGMEQLISEIHRAQRQNGIRMVVGSDAVSPFPRIETFNEKKDGKLGQLRGTDRDCSETERSNLREEFAYLLHRENGALVEYFINSECMIALDSHSGQSTVNKQIYIVGPERMKSCHIHVGHFIFDREDKYVKFCPAFNKAPQDCYLCGFLIEGKSILQGEGNICRDCALETKGK